ncbi:inositol monophosphatase family protein [Gloeobacter kilaueensis]|uniref:Inositol-1-monophosphatase n=1 Tax=Gloeobacter kilaueensis (strain ATCC BAA-2537 / CCAP 1431/1 / ULC 316 / JS1) TaxID=1183438 RepID=U5QMT6_GLOK1|nr:inositol monophosphatase family protein [Gloeobacter kilaueensis]AGY58899.1 inositol monophosphatase [Gloeobacter kilaueensis JS1]
MERFLDIACAAARAAGSVLVDYRDSLATIDEKTPGNLVTDADRAAEAVILATLKRHYPDHGILAEESGLAGMEHSPFLWAVDPLDGTTNFAHRYPVFAVSVGLLIDGTPVVGAIFDPVADELFAAARGVGAFCNGRPLTVSTIATLDRSLLATGFAYDRRETNDNNYAEFCQFTHLSQGVRRGGAAALDLAYVAAGRFDGFWERGLSPWDMAAGVVLVQEAGGTVSAYDGSPFDLRSGRILASNGHLHRAMSEQLGRVQPLPITFPL